MRVSVLGALLLLLPACFGGNDPNLTESGKGKPRISVRFPATVESGSVHEAVVRVSNPGPGDINVLAIAFSLVGPDPGATEFPAPLVALGARRTNESIVSVSPEPTGISDQATVYTFGPLDGAPRLPTGGSITITFVLKVPEGPGSAANSIQAYDGHEIDRARGVRLATEVRS
jgi:hypothetical protein